MIVTKKIQHQYSSLESMILDDINLTINSGEILIIMGPSGSGKSTLLKVLSGILKPTHGIVEFCGDDIYQLSDQGLSALKRENFGFMFQDHCLIPQLTLEENCYLLTGKNKNSQNRFKELAIRLGVEKLSQKFPALVSGGERQRFSFIRSLMHNPKIVFADEPSGSLDKKNSELLNQTILDTVKELSTSFIVVTHEKSIKWDSYRKLILENGQLIDEK